ncbi:cytochrome c maturation protein CcmE [Ostreibacterium oceani]|uniref:Cytochrome c-type biogenesis protein CcmE n=1 Tax=Ostreibacterium oceani TaxID=2654998 RepID=A0A6N7EWU9_9GAMM|nr:cytochrome c maturation protein CcmE [Ostreibacterium oceani]MPV86020.1 cytochrome c maturation protein CcmE [Ostreibacterium oceani]
MKPARKRRLITLIAVLVGVSSALSLLLVAKGSNLNHYMEISEVHAGNAPIGKTISIGGLVEAGSIERTAGSLQVVFSVTDTKKNITVHYEGILPDLFREGQGVLARGKLIDKQTFVAHNILAKHDENYLPKEVKAELEKQGYFQQATPTLSGDDSSLRGADNTGYGGTGYGD